MKLSNLKVGTRLMAGFGLLIVMLVAIGSTGLLRMAQIESRLETIVQQNVAKSNLAMKMRQSLDDRMIALRNLALLAEDHELASQSARVKFANTTYAKVQGELERLMNQSATEEEKAFLASIKKQEATAAPLIDKAITLGMEHRTTEIIALLVGDLGAVQREWGSAMTQLIEFEEQRNEELMQEAQASFAKARLWMLGLSLLAVLVGIAAAVMITRSLLLQLGGEPRSAMEVAARIAGGDLAVRVPVRANDRSSLMAALEDMRARLAGLVVQVRGGTEAIATASAQIASGNMDLSSRTEQQASSLEETASAMEELTSTVRQNADNARQANQLAENASDVAAQGGAVVSQVVDTMGAINESARKIADIIGVIDGIAFQTNILALNAAVEAARAGEQGRGFAVVATEVRSLAQRSAAAAKEIKMLIGDSVSKVGEGSALVDKAGATMHEVVNAVRRVTDIMGEITAASQEQSAGIEQVNQAVSQMDQVTQQNAALVEEAAAASASMQEQSHSLAALVASFKVDAQGAAAAVSAAPRAQVSTAAKPAAKAAAAQVRTPVPALPQAEAAASKPVAKPAPQSGRTVQAAGEDWEEF